jgi:hypothetical protein
LNLRCIVASPDKGNVNRPPSGGFFMQGPTFMAIFSACISGVAVAAAQDVFEIVAGPATRVRLREVRLGQTSDYGDAAAEGLSVTIIRGFTTAGSGGAAVTPANLAGHAGAPAATSAVQRNNTTLAQDGSGVVLCSDAWSLADGWCYAPAKDETPVLDKSQRLVVRISAPADEITVNATLVFEEIGEAAG